MNNKESTTGGETMEVPENPSNAAQQSPLENLPESISAAEVARRSNEKFKGGGY